jgi:hypothetical protein
MVMEGNTLAFVVVRAVALWIFTNGVLGLSLLFQQWLEQPSARQAQVVILLANTALPIATAVLVWVNADWLAGHVVPHRAGSLRIGWDLEGVTRLAVATVGLVTLAHVIPTLAWQTSVAVSLVWWRNTLLGPMSAPADLRAQYWGISGRANIVSEVVTAILGLTFVLAPGRVAAFLGMVDRWDEKRDRPGGDGAVQQADAADEAQGGTRTAS